MSINSYSEISSQLIQDNNFKVKTIRPLAIKSHIHRAQWFIRWLGGEDQAQRESYIKIHQHYPSNRANSRHNKTNEARKLKMLR